MPNLETNNQTDKDLIVVKSNDVKTSLSLSEEGNGAKVDGDLIITKDLVVDGNIKGVSDSNYPISASVINVDTLKNLSSDDITVDIPGNFQFKFSDYGPIMELDATNFEFKLFAQNDLNDYFRIFVTTNGATKLSTNDQDGTNFAYLNLNPEGDLWLKPITGKTFIVATKGFYFDTGVHTYITESSDDVLDTYVGGVLKERITEGGVTTLYGDIRALAEGGGTYTSASAGAFQTRSQIQDMIVQTAEITISEAEMDALHTTEKVLVSAQGAGKVIIPLQVTAFVDKDPSTAQNGAGSMWISYDGETTTGNCGYFKRFMRAVATDRVLHWFKANGQTLSASSLTTIDNVPLTAKMDFAITSASIDSCKLVIQYYVYDNS